MEDVDAAFLRLRDHVATFVQETENDAVGNRSLLFRDPDGNLINLFTPVTPQAIRKFQQRSWKLSRKQTQCRNVDPATWAFQTGDLLPCDWYHSALTDLIFKSATMVSCL